MKSIEITRRASVAIAAAIVSLGLAACHREGSYQSANRSTQPSTSSMGAPSEKFAAKVDDAKIVTKVKAGLAADKDVSALKIDVDSNNGAVTLIGSVPNEAAKAKAVQIARDVKDVKSVDSQLKVTG